MDDITNDGTEVTETPEPVVEPYESEGARRLRIRAEAKAEAAITMEANAKAAQKAKAKRLRGAPSLGMEEFNKNAREIEKSINRHADTDKEG